MGNIARQLTIRVTTFLVIALSGLTVSRADVIQPTVELPPLSGAYTLGGTCVSALGRCTQNAMVSDFDVITRTLTNGNEQVLVSATYTADIYTNAGGVPGMFLGHLSLDGTVQFTYFGRNPGVNPLGTFVTQITDFGFEGILNGNTFEIRQAPGQTSGGTTTILPFTFVPPILYVVSGSLEILAQYSFNGSPFVAAPPRVAELNPIPEPRLSLLTACAAAALAMAGRRHSGR